MKKKIFVLMFAALLVLFSATSVVVANTAVVNNQPTGGNTLSESDKAILKKMRTFEINSQTGTANDFGRSIGFAVAKGLGSGVDSLSAGIHDIYSLLSFGSSSGLLKLIDKYSALYKAIFMLSLVFLGIYMLLGKNGNQINTVNCILIMVVVIIGMPLFTQKMAALTVSSATYAQNQWTESGDYASVAGQALKENIVDLKQVDKNGIDGLKKGKSYNNILITNDTGEDKSWRNININAIMDWDTIGAVNKACWKYTLDEEGNVIKQDNGFLGIGKSYYYRYQVISWFNIIAQLIIIMIVFLFAVIKMAKLVWEVAMAEIYIPFIAITDIAGGQRIKEAIKHFIILFFCLFLCVALLGIYFVADTYIAGLELNGFLKIILRLALAWAIIDGPNIIERILGVDIGIKSGWAMLIGVKSAADLSKGTAAAAAGAGKAAGRMGKTTADAIAGKKSQKETTVPKDGKRHGGVAGMLRRDEKFNGQRRESAEPAGSNTSAASTEKPSRQKRNYTGNNHYAQQGNQKRPGSQSNRGNTKSYSSKPDGRVKDIIPPQDRPERK